MSGLFEDIREELGCDSAPSNHPICPRCGSSFQPRRTNQIYCHRKCQKTATHNANRGSRSASESPERRHEKRRQRATLAWLNETFYGTKPGLRLGLLKEWLDYAREGETGLRAVLSRPDFRDVNDLGVHHRRNVAYPPVPYLADLFCQRLLGCRVWDWVHDRAIEPETGEVIEDPQLA